MELFIQESWKIFRDLHPRQDSDQLSGPEYNVFLGFYTGLGQIGSQSDSLFIRFTCFIRVLAFLGAEFG